MVVEGMIGQVGTTVGTGALAGGVSGFAAKKLFKVVLAVVGLQIALFAYLDHRGILAVEWSALDGVLATVSQRASGFAEESAALATTLPVGVGFAGGFLFGFKRA